MSQGTPRSLCSRTMQLHKCEYKYQLIAFLKICAWLGNSPVSLWDEDGGCWPPSWILRHGAREDMSACDQTGQCCHEYWFKNVLFYSESKLSVRIELPHWLLVFRISAKALLANIDVANFEPSCFVVRGGFKNILIYNLHSGFLSHHFYRLTYTASLEYLFDLILLP